MSGTLDRWAAVWALGELAPQGDRRAILALSSCLGDVHEEVRRHCPSRARQNARISSYYNVGVFYADTGINRAIYGVINKAIYGAISEAIYRAINIA